MRPTTPQATARRRPGRGPPAGWGAGCGCKARPAIARRAFHQWLDGAKTPFLVAELGPDVEPFLLHLYAALAEKERAVISQRTKRNSRGQYLLWLNDAEANRLNALRRRGESYSDAIIRLTKQSEPSGS